MRKEVFFLFPKDFEFSVNDERGGNNACCVSELLSTRGGKQITPLTSYENYRGG